MAVLITVPLIIAAAGLICTEEKRKGLYCGFFGVVLLFAFILRFSVGDYDSVVSFLDFVPTIGFNSLSGISKPDGFIYSAYLFKTLCAENSVFFWICSAVWAALTAFYIYKRSDTPYASAVAFICSGFFLISACDFSAFTASLIVAYAFIYAEEQRFFRFAALILLASLFNITAVLMLPFFFLLQIKGTVGIAVTLVLCTAVAALALVFPEYTEMIFGFLPMYDSPVFGLNASVFMVCVAAVFLLICILARKMLKKRDNLSGVYIMALIFGTMFLVLSMSDGRFSALALFFLMPSLTVLSGELFSIGKQLLVLTFGENARLPLFIGGAAAVLISFSVYGYFVISDFYGINPYNITLWS